MKKRLDTAAKTSGRSQSQEAEFRLESTFHEDDALESIFGKAVETALSLLHFGHSLRGTVQTKGDINGKTFVFVLEGDADEAVERDADTNIPYADDARTSTSVTLSEYRRLAQKNRVRLVSPATAAAAAADAALEAVKRGRKAMSHEQLAAEIRSQLLANPSSRKRT
jgi:hypothetical protein